MNIEFRIQIWVNPEFLDFLLHLLKPSKIVLSKSSSWAVDTITLVEARFISLQELKRELQNYSGKHGGDGDINLEIKRLELNEEEKTHIDQAITFEKAIH